MKLHTFEWTCKHIFTSSSSFSHQPTSTNQISRNFDDQSWAKHRVLTVCLQASFFPVSKQRKAKRVENRHTNVHKHTHSYTEGKMPNKNECKGWVFPHFFHPCHTIHLSRSYFWPLFLLLLLLLLFRRTYNSSRRERGSLVLIFPRQGKDQPGPIFPFIFIFPLPMARQSGEFSFLLFFCTSLFSWRISFFGWQNEEEVVAGVSNCAGRAFVFFFC